MKNSPLGDPLPPFGGNVTSPEGYLLALWMHECKRVFADKLIENCDKEWVDMTVQNLINEHFEKELSQQVLFIFNLNIKYGKKWKGGRTIVFCGFLERTNL